MRRIESGLPAGNVVGRDHTFVALAQRNWTDAAVAVRTIFD